MQHKLAAQSEGTTTEKLTAQLLREQPGMLASEARKKGNAVQGAILFAQKKLNCVGCHAKGASNLLGPDLTQTGTDIPDGYFVESILNPSKVIKKGFGTVSILDVDGRLVKGRIVDETATHYVLRDTSSRQRLVTVMRQDVEDMKLDTESSMPEGLADQLQDRQEFLDLVKYLMDIAATGVSDQAVAEAATRSSVDDRVQGIALVQQYHCTSCHASGTLAGMLDRGEVRSHRAADGLHVNSAPDLASVGSRVHPDYIRQFIVDPHGLKPGTGMPQVLGQLDPEEQQETAEAITHFLVSLSQDEFHAEVPDADASRRGMQLFHSVGCVACHSPRGEDGHEKSGEGSVPLGNPPEKYSVKGLTAFLENPHRVRPAGRMPNMKLDHWEALDIASYLLSLPLKKTLQPGSPDWKLDPSMVAIGKKRFAEVGCNQCHQIDGVEVSSKFTSFSALRPGQGCLSVDAGKWPAFQLTDDQRAAINIAIEQAGRELTRTQKINVTLQTFRCYACHQRDGIGGVSDERDPYFLTTNENLGPQGRIPPPLTGVGAKLKPKWLRQVLVSGRAIRPYVQTRMPQFGTQHVEHLVDLFQQTDELPAIDLHQFDDPREIRKTGAELVGSGGLNCIACHTFQQKPALTMPGVDLTEMAERLHGEWFYRYMRSPQTISPNTVMPSFWPGGKAIRREILDGDTDQQIGAVWEYLKDGRQARVPRGLRREPIELLATDGRAAILRRSYQGIGKRGIGVGYPGGVNLAFDAEQLRIAMIWKGKFADPAGVWRSQGHGTVRPLGSDLIRFEAGPELDSRKSPWIVDEGRPPRHRFTGYFLDKMDRPTFTYQLDNVDVEDFSRYQESGSPDSLRLKRTLVFQTDRPRNDLAFRLRTSLPIQKETEHRFRLGNDLRVEVDPDHAASIVSDPAGSHLHIPLDLKSGRSQLILDYVW